MKIQFQKKTKNLKSYFEEAKIKELENETKKNKKKEKEDNLILIENKVETKKKNKDEIENEENSIDLNNIESESELDEDIFNLLNKVSLRADLCSNKSTKQNTGKKEITYKEEISEKIGINEFEKNEILPNMEMQEENLIVSKENNSLSIKIINYYIY